MALCSAGVNVGFKSTVGQGKMCGVVSVGHGGGGVCCLSWGASAGVPLVGYLWWGASAVLPQLASMREGMLEEIGLL